MSIESRIRSYEPVFREWQVKEYLGGGSGGQTGVYRIVRPHSGWEEVGALKVVTIVEAKGKLQDQSEAYQQDYLRHRQQLRARAEQEVQLMYRLRDCPQVVNYQDYTFVNWQADNSYGCDMLIRMELLTSLETVLMRQTFHESGVLRVGRDLTEALIRCHQEGIIHRDIKPANIFVTDSGNYKLGDFGIARILDDTQFAYTSIGTRAYASPEQTRQETYDHRVDIYSLGLTLYELSNGGKLPYAESGYIRHDEVLRRLNGEPLPSPSQASPALAAVILKACAYSPDQRYPDARAFQRALEEAGQKRSQPKKEPQKQQAADPYATAYAQPGQQVPPREPPKAEPVKTQPPPKVETPKSGSPKTQKKTKRRRFSGGNKVLVGLVLLGVIGYLASLSLPIMEKLENRQPNTYSYQVMDCSWTSASVYAQAMGGKLVSIDSKEELDVILDQLNDQGYQDVIFYVGACRWPDAQDDYPGPTDYYWTADGIYRDSWMGRKINRDSGWLADLWQPGEPSLEYNGNLETCLTLEYINGRWGLNDVRDDLLSQAAHLSGRVGYIVEYEE
ncbi:MAG: protein kinase [Ruminiclostridium sp.]|nr:protein kinase [Ruminiclostridium sp.]